MLSRILFSSSTANFPDELIRTLPFRIAFRAYAGMPVILTPRHSFPDTQTNSVSTWQRLGQYWSDCIDCLILATGLTLRGYLCRSHLKRP
ncbi:hypothetical protein CWO84_02165 [Methylomonas sp. Kb3]|uniref:hypothetical protein n=1 Tax=Methylomonas sp. Kb3 TaxID=1611544 RepID=UPI000C330730|nr:hypothetical protein [Methylomonas sp. Kb3]PKD41860.1 hypothetical protein CWO84_02165 [Methylomonas sp. Kb3]